MYKVVSPHDRTISYINVPANSESEWSDATTYGVDDLVQVTDIPVHKVYKSLRDNNTNRYPPDHLEPFQETATSTTSLGVSTGSKSLTTQAGKGFDVGMVLKFAKTVTPNTVNMTGEVTAYNSSTGAMTVSVYSVTGSGTHAGWTITTEDEISFWEEVGATNQHKMIDEYVNTKTENTTTINFKLPIELADYLVLFGLVGNTVDVVLRDETDTTALWSDSYDLIYSGSSIVNISNWYEYFFGEFAPREELVIPLGLILSSAVLEVTISVADGETAACGNIIIGRGFQIGETQFGLDFGIQDFSIKETDESGRTKLEAGAWAKKMDSTIYMENSYVDVVHRKMSKLVGIPTAWIADDGFESGVVYGTFRDFSIAVEGPSHSFCSLEVEGLI